MGSTGDPDDAEGSPERYCWREKIGKERVRHAGTNTPMIPYSPAAGLTPDHIHRLLCAATTTFDRLRWQIQLLIISDG